MKEAPIFFSQEGKHYMSHVTPNGTDKLVEVPMPKNDMLHADNLAHADNIFYKGKFYRDGVAVSTLPKQGTVFEK